MRAILVSVDHADLLNITLPYNRHHFEEVMVVTIPGDSSIQVAQHNSASIFTTTAFYDDGAMFNKWKALEQGLDAFGRHGWLCLMDADILWPKNAFLEPNMGHLYTPLRRMLYDIHNIPQEEEWKKLPIHRNIAEWAGYSQIFHAEDVHLGQPPWHQINWRHAGGADSFFQLKWPTTCKIRPSWEVLHLGQSGVNWCGRSTPYLDGSIHVQSQKRQEQLRKFIRSRRKTGYEKEKL